MDSEFFLATDICSGSTSFARLQAHRCAFFVLQNNRNSRKRGPLHFAGPPPSAVVAKPLSPSSLAYKLYDRFSSTSTLPAAFGERRDKSYTARDISLGLIDVFGWTVEADGKGEVGKVADILHIGMSGAVEDGITAPYEYILKVVRPCSNGEKSGNGCLTTISSSPHDQFAATEIKILIPIVDEFMQQIDPVRKRLLVKPPTGLLELAARPEAILKLQPEIQLFCKRYAKFLQERFVGVKKHLTCTDNGDFQEMVYTYMPTRDQMYAVGRPDLVRRIKDAGGFLYVANVLGLKTTRRPNGFWDDLRRLDFEIECFLLESWVKHVHEETGQVYFKNPVTNEVTLKKPAFSGKSSPVTSGESSSVNHDAHNGSKVMPRMRLLGKAGRWDLHHAIVWNGGYREVARLLGRRLIRSSKKSVNGVEI